MSRSFASLLLVVSTVACSGSTSTRLPDVSNAAATQKQKPGVARLISDQIDKAEEDRRHGMEDRAFARLREVVEAGDELLSEAAERGDEREMSEARVELARGCLSLSAVLATVGKRDEQLKALHKGMQFAQGTRMAGTMTGHFLTALAAAALARGLEGFPRATVILDEAEQAAGQAPAADAASIRSQILNLRTRAIVEFVGSNLLEMPFAELPLAFQHYVYIALKGGEGAAGVNWNAPLSADATSWLRGQHPVERALLREALRLNAESIALDKVLFVNFPNAKELTDLEIAKDTDQQADIVHLLGDAKSALSLRQGALATFDRLNMFEDAVITRNRIVRLQLALNNPREALMVSAQAIAQIEDKTGALSGRSLGHFLEQFHDSYQLHHELLANATNPQTGQPPLEQLILHADRSNFRPTRRDFSIYRTLGEQMAKDPALRARMDAQRKLIADAERRRDDAIAEGKDPSDSSYRPAPGIRVDDPFAEAREAKEQLVELLENIKRRQLGAATAQSGLVKSLEEVREGMPEDSAIVFYFRDPTPQGSFRAAVLGGDGSVRLAPLRGSREETSKAVHAVRRALSLDQLVPEAFRALAASIWEPLGPLPKHLTIVPNAELAGISFEALPGRNGRPAILDHTIRYAFGLAKGIGAPEPSQRIAKALVAGADQFAPRNLPALPSSQLEMQEVRKLLEKGGASVEPANALPENGRSLFAQPGQFDLVLISTHGIVDPDVPMADGLAFPKQDVDAWDIAVSRIRANLVILSACELMGSRGHVDDPVSGVATAALARMTPRLVSALWNVNEVASRVFMARFASELVAGENAATALAHVKRDFINGKVKSPNDTGGLPLDFRAPYYWAPFVLTMGAGG